ncbi:unnamed protein product [Lepeophtheirus salmonis]|uniref:(salmon louse) hypothetical protein n=1 Tax=Lepeophtheirus salmonis TaxID=72036 RepID=A0A7R8H2Y4_LEPSM|nr:unnamed protein product [Lepeophtheirus salmonis]CAF2837462.1 unnamed protein product [Lepeophtheirus salmonis]
MIEGVRLAMEMDRRVTVRELFLDLSLWTLNQILTKDLCLFERCARRILTKKCKMRRVDCANLGYPLPHPKPKNNQNNGYLKEVKLLLKPMSLIQPKKRKLKSFLDSRGIKTMSNKPYSSNLSSPHFFLFPQAKKIIAGRLFGTVAEVKSVREVVTNPKLKIDIGKDMNVGIRR